MNYNLLFALIIIIFLLFLYNYFNKNQEGYQNKNNDDAWIETKKVWTISFRRLLTQIEEDNKNIKILEDNSKKYDDIYDCLKYRQVGLTAKTQQKNVGNAQNADKRKAQSKLAIKNLKTILNT
jgi:hypothetical protein